MVRLSQQLPQDTVSGLPYAYSPELHARLRALGEASELESDADRRSQLGALLEDYLRTVAGPELQAAREPTWDLLSGHAQHRWRAHANGGLRLYHLIVLAHRAALLELPDAHLASIAKRVEKLAPGSLARVKDSLAQWAIESSRSNA